jgi:transcriptional regulator with XRE-family HTH domain
MISFKESFMESFLGVIRKYMQLRGGLTQKDLSELTGVGISTMSRFLNLKTTTVDEQLVANIMACLNIPTMEVIDGVDENSEETFKRLIQFYKDQATLKEKNQDNELAEGLGGVGNPRMTTNASVNIGGKKQNIPFGEGGVRKNTSELSIRDKLETLSPRQKAYLTDFLGLEQNDRDLIVDLGDAVLRYFRQRSVDF